MRFSAFFRRKWRKLHTEHTAAYGPYAPLSPTASRALAPLHMSIWFIGALACLGAVSGVP
jgi:hypothetical protein